MNEIVIGEKRIGLGHPPFVIAEMSGNHNQSLDRALQLVDAAAAAGAHALKLQTYRADTMTLNLAEGDFFISDPTSPWSGRSLYQLYEEAYTPWEWHAPIFERCRQKGLIAFSTPFDETAITFLEDLQVPCYKIASFENSDLALIRKVAATGKPVIISTGMASLAELSESVEAARSAGCKDLILLKCTSSYPASPANSHLRTLPHLRDLFACEVGLSDHTGGVGAAVASIALTATVIEKHFTLRRADGGVDAKFSLEPEEFQALVVETLRAWESLGEVHYGPTAEEHKSMVFRRSLYITQGMQKGETFTATNLRAIRPGFGLPPKFLNVFLGKTVARDVKAGTPAHWDLLG